MLLTLLAALPCWYAPTPPNGVAPVPVVLSTQEIDWFLGPLYAVRAKAQAENKAILFVVYTDNSVWCDKLFKQSLSDPAVVAEAADLVCVKVNLTRDQAGKVIDATAEKIASRFPVRSFPTMLFLGTNLAPEDLVEGFIPAAGLASELQRMKSGTGILSSFRAAAQAAPGDVEALWNLAVKVDDLGYVTEHQEIMDQIRQIDPKERSRPMRSLKLQILEEQLFRSYTATGTYEVATLTDFLNDEPNASVAFQGWSTLAGLARNIGGSASSKKQRLAMGEISRDAHKQAWPVVANANRAGYAVTVLNDFFEDRDRLRRKDRSFVKSIEETLNADLVGKKLAPNIEAVFADARACAAAIAGELEVAKEWITQAIALDPATPSYAKRSSAIAQRK